MFISTNYSSTEFNGHEMDKIFTNYLLNFTSKLFINDSMKLKNEEKREFFIKI